MRPKVNPGKKTWAALFCAALTVIALSVFAGMYGGDTPEKDAGREEAPAGSGPGDFNAVLDRALAQAKAEGKTEISVYPDEKGDVVQAGDMVDVDYSLRLHDRTLIKTTLASEAGKRGRNGEPLPDPGDIRNEIHRPETFVITGGMNGTDITGYFLGMKKGEKKRVTLEPGKGGLSYDEKKVSRFPRFRQIPLESVMDTAEFKASFGNEPEKGGVVMMAPHVAAEIRGVKDGKVLMAVKHDKDREERDSLGLTKITKDKNQVVLELVPDMGAEFVLDADKGRVSAMDKTHFTVDFNPRGAGKPMTMEATVVNVVKASKIGDRSIFWITDYERGVEAMGKVKKPLVLFLYKKDCPWCEKTEKEVFPDPRLRTLAEDYLWVKVDSSANTSIKEKFKQEGYPMTVLMNTDRSVYRDLKGYRDASKMRNELLQWSDDRKTGKKTYEQGAGDPVLETEDCRDDCEE